jgi:hypothetical protein
MVPRKNDQAAKSKPAVAHGSHATAGAERRMGRPAAPAVALSGRR